MLFKMDVLCLLFLILVNYVINRLSFCVVSVTQLFISISSFAAVIDSARQKGLLPSFYFIFISRFAAAGCLEVARNGG